MPTALEPTLLDAVSDRDDGFVVDLALHWCPVPSHGFRNLPIFGVDDSEEPQNHIESVALVST
jgi:hypothetical protein